MGKNSAFDKKLWVCCHEVYENTIKCMTEGKSPSVPDCPYDNDPTVAFDGAHETGAGVLRGSIAPGVESARREPGHAEPEPQFVLQPVIDEEISKSPATPEPFAAKSEASGEYTWAGLKRAEDKKANKAARTDGISIPPADLHPTVTEMVLSPRAAAEPVVSKPTITEPVVVQDHAWVGFGSTGK